MRIKQHKSGKNSSVFDNDKDMVLETTLAGLVKEKCTTIVNNLGLEKAGAYMKKVKHILKQPG